MAFSFRNMLTLLAIASVLCGCASAERLAAGSDSAAVVLAVEVIPELDTLAPGETLRLRAAVRTSTGPNLLDITWASSNATVATVGADGLATAVAPGRSTIRASAGGLASDMQLVVVAGASTAIASLEFAPGGRNVSVGQTLLLSPVARDASGNVLTGRSLEWNTSNSSIATVSPLGVVTGVSPGEATISVSAEGRSARAIVTISLVPVASIAVSPRDPSLLQGQSLQLSTVVRDANGIIVTDRDVRWASRNAGVAQVSGSGLASAVGIGTAWLVASSEGRADSTMLTVTRAPVASVSLSPAASTLQPGGSLQLTASVRDASGTLLGDRAVSWSSSNSSIASVSSLGFVTAIAVGSATITATSEGRTGTASITVQAAAPSPVATVTVSPVSPTMTVGGTLQLAVTLRDAGGSVLSGRGVAWSSSAPTVASVSGSGLVTAVSVGTATITATSEGRSGAVSVTVNPVPVVSVSVTPASASLMVGQGTQLQAIARDASGVGLPGRAIVWATSAPSVATVSSNGYVTAVAAGGATISATSEGRSGTAAITVSAAAPAPPAAPSALTATAASPTQIDLRWTDNSDNETGFAIERRTGNGVFAPLAMVNANVTTFSNTGLTAATAYTYRARAVNGAGYSSYSATASATTPPATGSTPSFPNEPAGMAVITQHGFSTVSGAGFQLVSGAGSARIVSDPSAPHSPTSVLEFGYPAGLVAGYSPGTMYYPPQLNRHVFIALWIKVNAGWQTHPAANKIQYIYVAGQPMGMTFNVDPNGVTHEVNVAPQFRNGDYVPVTGSAPFVVGQWNLVEWELKMNDAGRSNGLMRVWVNGVQRINLQNLDWFPPTGGFENYLIDPIWGGVGGTKVTGNDYFRVDHVYISGR